MAEAEYVDGDRPLWYLRYPLTEPVDGLEYLVVATRPETMLGDTGVAVNPKDGRKHLVGKTVKLPLVEPRIPIFADWHVDMEFGTGCRRKPRPRTTRTTGPWASATASSASTSSTRRRTWSTASALQRHGPRRGARSRGGTS